MVYRPGEPECAHQSLPFVRIGFVGDVLGEHAGVDIRAADSVEAQPRVEQAVTLLKSKGRSQICVLEGHAALIGIACAGGHFPRFAQDRKRGVWGKNVSVRLESGGRRTIKKTKAQ